jgi:hypothetical protein
MRIDEQPAQLAIIASAASSYRAAGLKQHRSENKHQDQEGQYSAQEGEGAADAQKADDQQQGHPEEQQAYYLQAQLSAQQA